MLRRMDMQAVVTVTLGMLLLGACGSGEATLDSAADGAAATSSPSQTPPSSAGRIESLECGEDKRSSGLTVDYGSDAVGHSTPIDAAHVLADEQKFPRSRYRERTATTSLQRPVFEYLTDDGRVIAYIRVDEWTGGTWMASGLTACQSYHGG